MSGAIDPVRLVGEVEISDQLSRIGLLKPAMTRLEPQSVSGDPAPGAVANIADPLWLIGRQWQLGELLGEDVGSAVSVEVSYRVLPVTAWAPTGRMDGTDAAVNNPQWQPWPNGAVLDELVEHVPRVAAVDGLRWKAETGAELAQMLCDAGQAEAADRLLADHPLTMPADPSDPAGTLDPTADRLFTVLGSRRPDGASARAELEAGPPEWVTTAADPGMAATVSAQWLEWVTGAPGGGGAWTTTRLEHRFRLRFGHSSAQDSAILEATEFGSGSARWHHFQWREGEVVNLDGDADLPDPVTTTDVMLATPLRYPAMPADRYWQLEDSSIDVAAIEAQPNDLARLCLAEFALVSGDDWLVVPVDGRVGAITQVSTVTVSNTFGEREEIAEAAADRVARGFRMFEVVSAGGHSLRGVVLPPIAHTPLLGEPIEEVAFIRDEQANMGWGIERIVPGRSGDPRLRSAEPQPKRPAPPDDLADGNLLYELVVPVPGNWIPLVPISTGYGEVGLRKGAMLRGEVPIPAASLLLRPTPLTFPNEEIPREGITVRAVPTLSRRRDGTYARWTGHRIRTGRGEGSSHFASDEARDTRRPGG